MLRKAKRVLKKMIKRQNSTNGEYIKGNYVFVDDEKIVIKKDYLEESLPAIHELAGQDDQLIPRRKVTHLKWNGPIMEIKGYFYLEGIPLEDEDFVKKRLYLVNEKKHVIELPLMDVPVQELQLEEEISDKYKWAGFEGKFNFSTINSNKPLPEAEYKVYLHIEVQDLGGKKYFKTFPLGNVRPFLDKGFHSAKMEYFSARKQMKYNLLATYDLNVKTLKIKSNKLKDLDPALFDIENLEKRGLFYRFFSTKVFRLLYRFFCLLPLNERKVLFASDSREELSGNFYFVYQEMQRRQLDFEYKFMLKSSIRQKKTYKEIVSLAYHLATSKFILLDDFFPMVYPLKIRKNAELIQLWHAVGAFKTFGFSRLGLPGGPSPKSKNHRNYTKAIVSSHHVAKHYAEGFGIDIEKVVATGIPRTDVFFDEEYKKRVTEQLYQEYPFLVGKKVIMFAPTFRGNGQQSAYYPMEVLDLEKLYHALKDEYVFLYKIHPFVKNDITIPYEYSDFFYDFSSYREINDLLFITDILITDYSSVCFEFALLNRPMLFFAFDVEEYVQTRDFYYDYHTFIPGPLVRTTDEIIETIRKKDFKMEKIKPFVEYFFDHTDGRSSERVVDQLILGSNEMKA
ncbi:CDP-glycerol glycerophosphotransferase family protein [Caenibacillus caldisaponilyticus]|uniref:CDP-glycerol glycerophosphotransferase family protein n=1 Tax=Caenibacillus caldisaponilyticus TaxID=1674942 RepID=UPI001178C207|nr:CDP-glycerol glycerophosphotransferase family protein [Caenibacillus caldisaponilyticus]